MDTIINRLPDDEFDVLADAIRTYAADVEMGRYADCAPGPNLEGLRKLVRRLDVAVGTVDPEECPGCYCVPGEGLTEGCDHPDGCGYWRAG